MTLNLITRDQVKTSLGINDDTYDAKIDAMIPVVSSDVRRILNNNFDQIVGATFTASDAKIFLPMNTALGTVVVHDNIPQGSYLTSYNFDNGYYSLSATPTGGGSYVFPSILISQIPTISKMVWYKISKQNTDAAGSQKVSSESFGPVSKSYAASEINTQFDYPVTLINDLGVAFAAV